MIPSTVRTGNDLTASSGTRFTDEHDPVSVLNAHVLGLRRNPCFFMVTLIAAGSGTGLPGVDVKYLSNSQG